MTVKEPNQLFEQMQFDCDVASTSVQTAVEELNKAIAFIQSNKTRSEAAIGDGITELNSARELVPDAIEKLGVARGSAKIAAYNPPAVKAHKDEIVEKIKQIATWEKQVLKLDTAAAALVESRFAAQDKLWDLSKEYSGWVKAGTKIITDLASDQAGVRTGLDAIHAKALKCVEMRNAAGLSLANDDANELPLKRFEDGLTKLDALLKKLDEASTKVGEETRLELRIELSNVRVRRDGLAESLAQFKARKQAIKALKLAPIDIGKALTTLNIPSQHKAALAKALAALTDPLRIKALDELAKQTKSQWTGKAMLITLQRARVL
ncbi:MAG TPA: hypothetical protein VK843_14490 [Planctomycetota bacterium]|nr:hypothetical protein [Planctomycetota bacterium]